MQKTPRFGKNERPDNEESSCDDRSMTMGITRHAHSDDDSDEDTEDARSSDDADRPKEDSYADIKEQMYQDKLRLLKTQLQRLREGVLPEYMKKLKKLELTHKENARLREVAREYDEEQIQNEFINEKRSAANEFEERKIELRENLLSELEEKKRLVENERQSLDLTGAASSMRMMTSLYDPMDPMQKPVTRTLRKRTTENRGGAQPNAKRAKNGQPALNYILDEEDINEDLKIIQKLTGNVSRPSTSAGGDSTASGDPPPSLAGIRIENGKLFYDKKWFKPGQSVFLESKDGREPGVIMAIGHQDQICIRKVEDRTKTKIHLSQLSKQKFILRKRNP